MNKTNTPEPVSIVDTYTFLESIRGKVNEHFDYYKKHGKGHEQRYSIATRYNLTMHLLFGQLVHELSIHLDTASYGAICPTICDFRDQEHFQKAEFYLAKMMSFIQERYDGQVDIGSAKMLPVVVRALKMRTENPSKRLKVLYLLGLMEIQRTGVQFIMKAIDDLGWRHHIYHSNHCYYTNYIPLVDKYLSDLKTSINKDFNFGKDESDRYILLNATKHLDEYIDLMFSI